MTSFASAADVPLFTGERVELLRRRLMDGRDVDGLWRRVKCARIRLAGLFSRVPLCLCRVYINL